MWHGKSKKKTRFKLRTPLRSATVKVSKHHDMDKDVVDFKGFIFTLSPSQGGFECADYVKLEIHSIELLNDKIIGVAYIPIGDFDIQEREKVYEVSGYKQIKEKDVGGLENGCLTVHLKRLWSVPKFSNAASVPIAPSKDTASDGRNPFIRNRGLSRKHKGMATVGGITYI
jgi:hypothetical protein